MSAGRKPKWDELEMDSKLILVEGWVRDGYTFESIAKSLGVSEETFYKWKREKTQFAEALKKGQDVVDRLVENSLIQKAMGYSVQETEEIVNSNGEVTRKTKQKHIPGSDTAIIFFLKNRLPQKWNDKTIQDVNHNGSISMDGYSEEEIMEELKKFENKE